MVRRKVLIEGGVVWNSIWSHGHEIARSLAAEFDVYYLEPVRTRKQHAHLHEKTEYAVPKGVRVVQHERVLDDIGLAYLRYSEEDNLRILKEIRPDVLLTYQCLLGLRAFRYAKRNGIKTIYMLVDEYAALSKSLGVKAYLRVAEPYFLRNSDGVLCTAKVLHERALRTNQNSIYIPNGTNIAQLQKVTPARQGRTATIGFVGTLGDWVDTSWFIALAKAYPKTRVVVIGSGDGLAALQQAKEQDHLDNLHLPGFLPHKEAIRQMGSFTIALVPFKVNEITHAVSPLKLFEYWNNGKPVVCARTRELEQFKGCVVFAQSDSVARKVGPLLRSARVREQYAAKGKRMVLQYDWGVLGHKLNGFVKHVLAIRGAAR